MRKFIYILSIAFIVASCMSSTKMLSKGYYDEAINKSVSKILKDPRNTKEINVLSQSYKLANQKDKQTIEQLQLSGQPDRWDRIFKCYDAMNKRQETVARVQPFILTTIGYQYVDYNKEIVEAKKNASEYYYVHAKTLLDKKDRYDARQAYDELQRVKTFYPNYKDVDALIKEAYDAGLTYVLFKMVNNSEAILPVQFEKDLLNMSTYNFNKDWTIFHSQPIDNFYYDYSIIVSIKVIDISPESQNQTEFTETKQVQEGTQYKLDANGNVMKDANGNDITIPKYVNHRCTVTEVHQSKYAIIAGTVDFWENQSRQMVKSEPIRAQFYFNNAYATARGDRNILKPEIRRKLDSQFIPFPENGDMLMSTGNILKGMIRDIIRRNNAILK